MSQVIRRNIEYLEAWSEEGLRDWLLRAFSELSFEPLTLLHEPAYQRQLKILYNECSADVQNRLKSAVVRAVAECGLESHGPRVLRDLCLLASDIRASSVVRILRLRLESELIHSSDDEECRGAIRAIIVAIGRFAPLKEAEESLRRLLFDERFSPRFAASLVAALSQASPADYARYVPRLLELVDRYPEHYMLSEVIRELVRVIKPRTIMEHLQEIEEPIHSQFISLLVEHADEHLAAMIPRIEMIQGEPYVVDDSQRGGSVITRNLCELAEEDLRQRGTRPITDQIIAIIRKVEPAMVAEPDASEREAT